MIGGTAISNCRNDGRLTIAAQIRGGALIFNDNFALIPFTDTFLGEVGGSRESRRGLRACVALYAGLPVQFFK
jgi:hypothetical protein